MLLYEDTKTRGICPPIEKEFNTEKYRAITKGRLLKHITEYEISQYAVIERHIISIRFFDWLAKMLGKEENNDS